MATVEGEVQQLRAALDRTFDYDPQNTYRGQHHIVQVCPLCDAGLGIWFELDEGELFTAPQLRRKLFALYDEHRCVSSTDRHTMFERAERALLAAAERIGKLDDPELRSRAERESDHMARLAAELRAKF
jgi:hypothetical protein